METYPPDAWRRLGRTLEERRGQLGYGYRQRRRFLADRGGIKHPSIKTIERLERGERTFYPPATITYLEALYGYEPGAFEAILRGQQPAERRAGPAGAGPGDLLFGPEPADDLAWELFPDDPTKRRVVRAMRAEGRSDEDIKTVLRTLDAVRREIGDGNPGTAAAG
jgi:transcriptional regulator with XRE-family HTH domain